MANVTPELVKALFTGFAKNFKEGLAKAPSQYSKIATTVKSTTASNTYGWLGQMPKLTEWIGKRTITAIQSHGYAIVNKDWASGVEIKRTDIEDDNIGIYSPLIEELGRSAGEQPDELVFGALKATARKLFRERYNGISSPKMTSKDAVQNLIRVWEGLSQNLNEE